VRTIPVLASISKNVIKPACAPSGFSDTDQKLSHRKSLGSKDAAAADQNPRTGTSVQPVTHREPAPCLVENAERYRGEFTIRESTLRATYWFSCLNFFLWHRRFILLGLTVLGWIFSLVSVAHCSFVQVAGVNVGLFKGGYEGGSCVKYGSAGRDVSTAMQTARAFGVLLTLATSFAMILVIVVVLFYPNKIMWNCYRVLLSLSYVFNMFTFVLFAECAVSLLLPYKAIMEKAYLYSNSLISLLLFRISRVSRGYLT